MTGTRLKKGNNVFKIFGHEFVEGVSYSHENEKLFKIESVN